MEGNESSPSNAPEVSGINRHIRHRLRDLSAPYGIDIESYSEEEISGFIVRSGITEDELTFWSRYYDNTSEAPQGYGHGLWSPEDRRQIDVIDQKLRQFYTREYLSKMTQEEMDANYKKFLEKF